MNSTEDLLQIEFMHERLMIHNMEEDTRLTVWVENLSRLTKVHLSLVSPLDLSLTRRICSRT
jgi:hypothetical protein